MSIKNTERVRNTEKPKYSGKANVFPMKLNANFGN